VPDLEAFTVNKKTRVKKKEKRETLFLPRWGYVTIKMADRLQDA
jgi:hypothetical protein